MIKHVNMEEYNKITKEGKLVLVDFYADWCGPCKMLTPFLEKLNEENEELQIIKVNVDQENELAREYGVMSIPTLLVYKDGEVVKKELGFRPLEGLREMIK
jgi:thioredoxin 1